MTTNDQGIKRGNVENGNVNATTIQPSQEKTVFRKSPIQVEANLIAAQQIIDPMINREDATVIANQLEKLEIEALRQRSVKQSATLSNNDATRISANIASTNEDATRFSPKVITAATNDDATRFSPKIIPTVMSTDDATLFSPKTATAVAIDRDSTQFRPGNSNRAIDLLLDISASDNAENSNPSTENVNRKMLKGRFVLEDVLGVGGMGIVYKAKDLLRVEAQDRDPYVAIKVLSEEFKTHPEAFISLQRESKKAQHIANQNTVKVYDFDRDGDVVFMTMEYMIGQPLDQMVKQYHATGLPRNETWNILRGMCLALIHAHSENIVHSDLKPGNVFVTDQGIAKIFDFGIARAVAKIDRSANEQDRTVFDAGNLGALTPAYASREMLLGQIPDVRDDIYALGCIAYEMITGDHPFTRLPADEAYDKKLKPKRITGIKKRHWKAIEAALAFKREDRIASVEEFYKQITEKKKTNVAAWFLFASAIAAAGYAYTELTKVEVPKISQEELMNQLEFKVRYQLLQENIDKLLADANFTERWQSSMWDEMQSLANLFPEKPTPWYFEKRDVVYQLYLQRIEVAISTRSLSLATTLITNAQRYSDDLSVLDGHKLTVEQLVTAQASAKKQQLVENKAIQDANELAAAEEKAKAVNAWKLKQAKQAKLKIQNSASTQQKENIESYNVAMDNVEQQLTCKQQVNMRDFKIAIEKLRSLDMPRYQKSEKQITEQLSSCISITGKTHPDAARDAKRYALLLFANNPAIEAITINDIDGCQSSIAGLGARGSRAVCKDSLKAGGNGPTMVVVPASSKIQSFAIGKYEITVGDYNVYCKNSESCQPDKNSNTRLPMTGVGITEISGYIKWLNKTTGKKYRLPTHSEWVYAANAKSSKLDPNRNCNISSRGITKGNELVKTTTGKQNSWGVVNFAGNAQELVYASGRELAAVGGSYKTSMDVCTSEAIDKHTGEADEHTGFRLVRNIVGS